MRGKAGLLQLVGRIDIAPGNLMLTLDAPALAVHLVVDADRLDPAALARSVPFQLRKRGVETKARSGRHSRLDAMIR